MRSYELLIVGTGPAGVQAALRAAREGRKTAVVERRKLIGGVCLHTGTIPSKTLRQAAVDLSGYHTRGLYEGSSADRPRVSMDLLHGRILQVIATELRFQENLLKARGVEVIHGTGVLLDDHTVRVCGENGEEEDVRGDAILIAVGTSPLHPTNIPFDGHTILDSDQLLDLPELPRTMIIIGGGVIGSEYASILSLMDVDVTLVNRASHLLPFVDEDIVTELEDDMATRSVRIRGESEVEAIEQRGPGARVRLKSGETLEAEVLMFCAGRQSVAPTLGLEAAGLACDSRGLLPVDEDFRTAVPNIFAAGDVIGFPSLASTSREQGRVAACRALDVPCRAVEDVLPIGIYTVPEIAMVGPTEAAAVQEGLAVVSGIGRYEHTARGQIIGDTRGLLKMVVDRESRRLLGAHMIGTGATELIHLAMVAIGFDTPYTYFVRTVMNYPTLSRVYKLAAWDVLEQLGD
jgi:NAD(P) transhydrogenase